jgi:Ca2+-binding RTX toxin-like protein
MFVASTTCREATLSGSMVKAMERMQRTTVVALLLGAGIGLYGAGPADAATAFVGPSPAFPDAAVVQYLAGPGEANRIVVHELSSRDLEITDTGATISVGVGCTSVSPDTARCSYPDCAVTFNLGDGADLLSLLDAEVCDGEYRGGEGNDTIIGGSLSSSLEYLFGGPGDDRLRGRAGDDVLNGGLGADTLRGGASLSCETAGFCRAGTDTVTYATRTNDVFVDTDGVADDGELLEGDMVEGIEEIIGGHGNDILVGTSVTTSFAEGRPRPFGTTILGGAGNDILRGGGALNWLRGDSGNDVIRGRGGPDLLSGRSGNDRLFGGPGRDTLRGFRGQDVLVARDGQVDHVFGGREHDRAQIDVGLDLLRDVETVLP